MVTGAARAGIEAEIRRRLGGVDDPCSVATAAPVSIVDLGLVRRIEVDEGGRVDVTITPTSPGCMVLPRIAEAVHEAAAGVPGVREVEVIIDHDFMWTQDAMAPSARQTLTERRERLVRRLDIRPRQWMGEVAAAGVPEDGRRSGTAPGTPTA
jgi:metal-sulfur cluster biosynthetic enzyme